jgi:hypothetical protein
MNTFLSRLTTFDWVSIVSYAIAVLTFLGGQSVLTTWGMSAADATMWSQRIATVVAGLTLISNRFKNPSPTKGTVPVLTTAAVPTPETLTTNIATATKGP